MATYNISASELKSNDGTALIAGLRVVGPSVISIDHAYGQASLGGSQGKTSVLDNQFRELAGELKFSKLFVTEEEKTLNLGGEPTKVNIISLRSADTWTPEQWARFERIVGTCLWGWQK